MIFVLLILFLILTLKKNPYSSEASNNLEAVSLIASMLTIYCGIYFIASNLTTSGMTANSSQGYMCKLMSFRGF